MSSPDKGQWKFWLFILFDVIALVIIGALLFRTFFPKEPEVVELSYEQPMLVEEPQMMEHIQELIAKGVAEQNKERFQHSVFLGDSLTEGLSIYGYVKTSNVVAQKGLSIERAMKKVNTIAKKKPQYVFVMLGINDLNFATYSMDDIEENYRKLVKKLHRKLPDAKIYVQSLLPVTNSFQKEHKRLSNKRINALNKRLKNLSKDYKYTSYVDIHKLYVNKKGCLSSKISSDGYHLKMDAYQNWVEYVKGEMKE
ncbi:MAG: GDSL-type esterase/lipase family protein [Lachnospiraceae bacterium]|nr:GDSL-type esterase/lipase family protein [Lachnospiraceae bacterium]